MVLRLCVKKFLADRNQKMCFVIATTTGDEVPSLAMGTLHVDADPNGKALSEIVKVGALE